MGFYDYLILFLYLFLLGIITWRVRCSSPDSAEFFLAGRKSGAMTIGLSVMVTTFSAVNYLALPGEVCSFGLYVLASLPVFFLAAWPVVRYWIPFFHRLKPVTAYTFLEERFDLRVRLFSSGLFLCWRIFWMAVALYASCRIMSLLTGLDFLLLVFLCGTAAALYSAAGGMRAVLWTDVMQFCVLFGSILVAVILSCRGSDFGRLLTESGRLRPFVPADWNYLSPDPRIRISFWSAMIGTFTAFLTRFGADQMVMQRYFSAKNLASAKRSLWISGFASTLSLGLLVIFGLALHVYRLRNGLPLNLPPIRITAHLLKNLPSGAAGLVGAGLLAATMSSIDSGLNSCCAAVATDFQERLNLKRISPQFLTLLLACFVMAGSAWILPVLNRNNTLFMILNKCVNSMGTPLLAVMLTALFFRKVRSGAVFYGGIMGTILTLIFSFTVQGIALHYYAVLSLAGTLLPILLFHLCSRNKA